MKEYPLLYWDKKSVIGKVICNQADELVQIIFETNKPIIGSRSTITIEIEPDIFPSEMHIINSFHLC